MELSAFRTRFQPLFEAFLRTVGSRDGAIAQNAFIERIVRYPEALAGGEGKRIRPYMAWVGYQGAAGSSRIDEDAVMKMLTSLELFHVFALIHDDVMDRGVTRHGLPTPHRMAEQLLKDEKRTGDVAHVADAYAILLGDLVFQWSQEAFFSTPGIDAAARDRAAPYFRAMIEEVIVGQMMDVDLTTRTDVDDAFVERKTHLKTSGYTFIRPLQIGAALAGASADVLVWCEQFGAAVGRAFQLQDDLMDLTVSSTGTGKTAFSDLQERQRTVFTQFIFREGTSAQKEELHALLGATLTEVDRPRVTALFESSGALAYGRAEIARSLSDAKVSVDAAPLHAEWKQTLREFLAHMEGRES